MIKCVLFHNAHCWREEQCFDPTFGEGAFFYLLHTIINTYGFEIRAAFECAFLDLPHIKWNMDAVEGSAIFKCVFRDLLDGSVNDDVFEVFVSAKRVGSDAP